MAADPVMPVAKGRNMRKRRNSGITLIELMVVVVIVAILAAIAYPSYRQQVIRSNRTEAKVALMGTSQALEKCFTRYMAYDHASCDAATQFDAGAGYDTPDRNYRITGNIQAEAYTLTATPLAGQLADTQCANLSLDEEGARRTSNGSTPAETCW